MELARTPKVTRGSMPTRVAARARPLAGHHHAIQNLVRTNRIQTKLTIGQPNDKYEREADSVADKVMRMSDADVTQRIETGTVQPLRIQRMCAECENELAQRKPAESHTKGLLGKGLPDSTSQPTSSIETRVSGLEGGGQALDPVTRTFFEPRFGRSFSDVRIHNDAESANIARAVNARAFTLGNHVVFGPGEYRPHSHDGRHLLGHELTHVVQQGQGFRKDAIQRTVNPARVSCHGYPTTYPIFRAIGTTDPVGALRAADTRAIEILSNTIAMLTAARARVQGGEPPAWPTIGDCMAQSMHVRLLIDPSNRRSWTHTGPNTVFRIIRMLNNLRGVFQGGNIRYICLDGGCGAGDDAFVIDGEGYLIRLCRGFWGMGTDYRAIVLIHELSHIYYRTEDRGFLGLGSAYCIEGFLNDLNNISVPPVYQSDCRGNRVHAC